MFSECFKPGTAVWDIENFFGDVSNLEWQFETFLVNSFCRISLRLCELSGLESPWN